MEDCFMPSVRQTFDRNLDSLALIFSFIDRFAAEGGVDEDSRRSLSLAIDELFTNTVRYHPANKNEILIDLRTEGEAVIVQLVDHDVEPFDITKSPDPDLDATLEKRTPGGLGVFLAKKFVDDVQYQYRDRVSTITLKKLFRRKDV